MAISTSPPKSVFLDHLERRVSAIPGTQFRRFQNGAEDMGEIDDDGPFHSSTTDEQLIPITGLYRVRFRHVIEVAFDG